MRVCCGNPECFTVGKVFNDKMSYGGHCNACGSDLIQSGSTHKCAGCGDDCYTPVMKIYQLTPNDIESEICCSAGCVATVMMRNGSIKFIVGNMQRKMYRRMGVH